MNRILVAYTTKSGSTAEVAEAVGEVLRQDGAAVEVRPIAEVNGLDAYSAVVVGGPMILGWHPDAVTFLQKHQETLSRVPVACFMTALSLTRMPETHHNGFPVFQDPALAKPPKRADRLNFKERYSAVASYLKPVAEKAPQVKPVGVAFFAGKLDFGTLRLFDRLFVQFIVGAKPGDARNWDAIRAWAAGVRPALLV